MPGRSLAEDYSRAVTSGDDAAYQSALDAYRDQEDALVAAGATRAGPRREGRRAPAVGTSPIRTSGLLGSPPSFGDLRGRLSSGSLTPEDISTYLNFVGDDPQSAVNNLLRSSGYNLSNRFVGRLGRNLGRGSTFALLAQALGGDVRPEEERNRSILESILGGAGTSTYTDPSYFTDILGRLNSAQRQIQGGGTGIPDAARSALESFYSPDFDTLTTGGRNLFTAGRSASTPAIFRQFADEALRRQTESWEDFLAPQNPSFNLLDYLTGSLGIPY